MPVTEGYDFKWKPIDKSRVIQILVDEHDFNKERVLGTLEKLESSKEMQQKGLGEFF
jgi:hypothetical protein